MKAKSDEQIAIFAAGCFWGVEEVFRNVVGVQDTLVGYTGGNVADPTYEKVCAGNTGHAEAVKITFDPQVVTYGELLRIFFDCHDPTTKDRQGPDLGRQYRSAIFYQDEEQKQLAEKMKTDLDIHSKFPNAIVTEIVRAQAYYPAEEYHQKYVMKKDK